MRDVTTAITRLEAALANPVSRNFKIDEVPDVLAQLLGDKRSRLGEALRDRLIRKEPTFTI